MTGKNALGENRRFWQVLPVAAADMLTMIAQQAEQSGMAGLFSPQVFGPPFIPLAAAAPVTSTITLATGIAIASTRSPFETAMAAIDMDRISNGRFILGLGTSVSAWTSGIFGTPDIKPVSHLRETVNAVRYIIANAHKGLQPLNGEYYKPNFRDLSVQAPPVREVIPIWIAALREKMARLGAEIGDGVIGHPMWSVEWTIDQMAPAILDSLAKAGRNRSDIEVNIWPWCAPNPSISEALDDARPTIAFYAGVEQYQDFFEAHGFLKEARACQAGVQHGDFMSIVGEVPDEMVRAFVAVGDVEQVRARLEPIWSIADSVCLTPPIYGLSPEKQMFYGMQMAEVMRGW